MDPSQITPQMAQAELARRQGASGGNQGGNPQSQITPQMARAELARREGMQPPQQNVTRGTAIERIPFPGIGLLPNLDALKRTGAAIGKAGIETLNIPAKLGLPYAKKIADPNMPYEKLGIEQGLADQLVSGALEFSPYMLPIKAAAGVAKTIPFLKKGAQWLATRPTRAAMATQAPAGALYGYTNAPEGYRAFGTIGGTGLGFLGPLAGKAGSEILKKGVEKYSQSAIPGFLKKAKEALGIPGNPQDYAKTVQGRFNKDVGINKTAFDNVTQEAKGMDALLGHEREVLKNSSILDAKGKPLQKSTTEKFVDFDNAPFKTAIKGFIGDIRKLEPALREPYKNAIGVARYLNRLAPKSFEGAVAMRKNLNEHLRNYYEKKNLIPKTKDEFTKSLLGRVKKSIFSTVDQNVKKVPTKIAEKFKADWEAANKGYTELQNYYKIPQGEGALKPTRQRREALESQTLNANAIGKYLPKQKDTTTAGFQQLEKVIGGPEEAKKALRSYYLNDILENGASPQKIEKIYGKLSPAQRAYLFGGGKIEDLLNTVNEVGKKFGLPKKENWVGYIGHHGLGLGAPAAVAGGATYLGGGDAKESVAAGLGTAAAIAGLKKGVGATATPKNVMKALQKYDTIGKKRSNLSQLLFQPLGRSMYGENERGVR